MILYYFIHLYTEWQFYFQRRIQMLFGTLVYINIAKKPYFNARERLMANLNNSGFESKPKPNTR